MEYEIGIIRYPAGFGMKDVLGWGTTGLVVHDKASDTVIKTPFSKEDDQALINQERGIYERLTARGGHTSVLRYHGPVENGIRLEYAPNGDIRTFRVRQKTPVNLQPRHRWATQIAEGLDFVRKAGVVHGDLTCHNVFLDEQLNAKLGDFGGSSLDGSELFICVTASHEKPGSDLSTPQADIFAFGSLGYEIMTGSPRYEGLSAEQIESRYEKGEFAETGPLGAIGLIINKCWLGQYHDFGSVVRDLKGIEQLHSVPIDNCNLHRVSNMQQRKPNNP